MKALAARAWRRIRVLLLLGDGHTVRGTAISVGGYPREISRVGKRYIAGGLKHALTDDPRPKPSPKLDSTQEAAVVALICGPPPEGQARWTSRLMAEEASRRGIVDTIGRETIRIVLTRRNLKPWREKMWCVPQIDQEFVDRMEDVLRLYARRRRSREPVVCLDERPVQLLDPARPTVPMRPGQPARVDYEYVREGTANIFCIVEPLTGRRLTYASANRKGKAFARALCRIAQRYREASKIHLVMDNLSTHSKKSLITSLGITEGSRVWRPVNLRARSGVLLKASSCFSNEVGGLEHVAVFGPPFVLRLQHQRGRTNYPEADLLRGGRCPPSVKILDEFRDERHARLATLERSLRISGCSRYPTCAR